LAYDSNSKAFVIIEYKNKKNMSVIDQGYAYLSLMLNNKADFILEYNEKQKNSLKRGDIDWSQSKVIFICPFFTKFQKKAINFNDLPIELWEFKKYQNNIISYSQIIAAGAQESVKTISRQNTTIQKVSKEIKVYTEEEHIRIGSDECIELYEKLKTALLNFENVELKPKKKYMAFVGSTNIVDILIQRGAIKMWLNLGKGELDDPKKIARDVSSVGHWGNGDYEIKLLNDNDFEYILSLIKQSYRKNK
jgi:predicted transport protein